MRVPYGLCLAVVLGLCACRQKDEPGPVAQPQGREETQTIRNTEAVGYSGAAIANKVDGVLNTNDRRGQALDATAAPAGDPPP